MRIRLCCVSLLLIAGSVLAGEMPVSYEISVSLDPDTHQLEGHERIEWTNTAGAPTEEIFFHLYLNAFAGSHSTFMKELGEGTLRSRRDIRKEWGWIRITSLKTAEGVDLLPTLKYVRPDDGNEEDFTVARVELPEAVEPSARIRLDLEYEARLPRVIARTGWAGAYHLVGQWYPKLGVFQTRGGEESSGAEWNCHQFHASSEFYSDFARYRVEIRVPDGMLVAATGIQLEGSVPAGVDSGTHVEVYTAENVHDFAWCAAPEDLMTIVEAEFDPARDIPRTWLEEAEKLLGLSAAELELPPVHLRLMLPRSQQDLAERNFHAARLALAWYGLYYGSYPYPQLTMISPPPTAEESGGMEYPTFITGGASRLLEYPPFSSVPMIEAVIIHEFGHQYFYGMLASNEFEQAWMDEGMNSYAEISCREAVIRDGLVPELPDYSPWANTRMAYSARKDPLRIDRFAWEFRTRRDYSSASYNKTALVLKTLEGLLGADVFARAMREYALSWRFHHPRGEDYFRSMEESTGEDLEWFFAQAFEGDARVDWAIRSVRIRPDKEARGYVLTDQGWKAVESTPETTEDDTEDDDEKDNGKGPWSVGFDVLRKGEFKGPVDILLIWEDQTEHRETWNGHERWKHFEFHTRQKPAALVLDPEGKWALETSRRDNYWKRTKVGHGLPAAWTLSLILNLLSMPWS